MPIFTKMSATKSGKIRKICVDTIALSGEGDVQKVTLLAVCSILSHWWVFYFSAKAFYGASTAFTTGKISVLSMYCPENFQ